MKHSHDETEMRRRKPTAEEQLSGTMFQLVNVEPRDYRVAPPSQSGSESSEDGAQRAKGKQQSQMAAILAVLALLPNGRSLSRDEICSRTGLTTNAACGRLNALVYTLGHVEAIERGATSNAGLKVTSYRLSEAGWVRIRKAS